ncbi:MAG: YdcF family protein [Chloroflexi bacterium]|nr:YdcF family protein [Chloroflexota bacterium]
MPTDRLAIGRISIAPRLSALPPAWRWRRPLRWLALAAVLLPLLLVVAVQIGTAGRRYSDPAQVPPARVAVVFGAGVRPDGTPSPMLADRIQAAARLYQAGRVQKLLMTGDNGQPDYNEVAAMRRAAIAAGVPAADITLDHAGFSTYESCYRAAAIFGVRAAVLVTQDFHLARAVYTCRQLGVDAVGLGTPDWGVYSPQLMLTYTLREALATLNALWQVHLTQPTPTYLGRFEGIA